jgi:aminopeptidase N
MQFAEDIGPMSHPIRPDSFIEINNFYTLTVYEKGAEVIRMYHTLLGEEGFQKGMKLYFQRHDGSAVTCNDYRLAMADANNVDLQQFELWYSQNGTPRIIVKEHYDAITQVYTLNIKQKPPSNVENKDYKPMHIPMRTALFDESGKQLALDSTGNQEKVFELKDKKHKIVFENIASKPIASLFRGFSSPVIVKFKRPTEDWLKLMTFDSDSYNRWDATQTISELVISDAYAAIFANKDAKCPQYYIDAIANVLTDTDTDPALLAAALSLPSLKNIMTSMTNIKVEKLYQAKEFIKKSLADALEIEFLSVYNQNFVEGDYQVNSVDVAKRSLKNTCLSYLMYTNNPDIMRLCQQQYDNANNMTDSITAFTLYVHHQSEGYDKILSEFYNKWKDNALVMDKWFSLQATSPAPGTLNKVIELMEHEGFSLENPNKVRALIAAFTAGNMLHFHQTSGKGYEFLADQVIALDKFNPQIASRMVSYFNNWKIFDDSLQKMMKQQLERIHKIKNLSPDVFEIVDKALNVK